MMIKNKMLLFVGCFLYSTSDLNEQLNKIHQRELNDKFYFGSHCQTEQELKSLYENMSRQPTVLDRQEIQTILNNKKNVAYLAAFACLCVNCFDLSSSMFDMLFDTMFGLKGKTFLKPYCLEIFLSSMHIRTGNFYLISVPCDFKKAFMDGKNPTGKSLEVEALLDCSREEDSNDSLTINENLIQQMEYDFVKDVLDGLNPSVKRFRNKYEENNNVNPIRVNPMCLIHMKQKSPSQFLFFALCMYFAEDEFDDQLFFTKPLFIGNLPYKNTRNFKAFLKIMNTDSKSAEFLRDKCKCLSHLGILGDCNTDFHDILRQMQDQLNCILTRDYNSLGLVS